MVADAALSYQELQEFLSIEGGIIDWDIGPEQWSFWLLNTACYLGCCRFMRRVLQYLEDVDEDPHSLAQAKSKCLVTVARRRNQQILQLLLDEYAANPVPKDKSPQPLTNAVLAEDVVIVRMLLEKLETGDITSTCVRALSNTSWSPRSLKSFEEIFDVLYPHCDNVHWSLERIIVEKAAGVGSQKVLRRMLQHHETPGRACLAYCSAIKEAAHKGQLKCLKFLLDGRDLGRACFDCRAIDREDAQGVALEAANNNRLDIFTYLRQHYPDHLNPLALTNHFHEYCESSTSMHLLQEMLQAKPDLFEDKELGFRSLRRALEHLQPEIVAFLLELGVVWKSEYPMSRIVDIPWPQYVRNCQAFDRCRELLAAAEPTAILRMVV